MLSIVEILKEFANILLGSKIIVHTDHKNLLYRSLPTQRLQRWRMLIEEYDCTFVHVAGVENVVADGISRLEANFKSEEQKERHRECHARAYTMCLANNPLYEESEYTFNNTPDIYDMAHSFVNKGEVEESEFPMYPPLIAKYQKKDKHLQKQIAKTGGKDYTSKAVEGVQLVLYKNKSYITGALQGAAIVLLEHRFYGQSRPTNSTR